MSSYWAAVGVALGLEGAAFKYFVWDFFFGKQSLEEYSLNVDEAHNAIYERKFLPKIVSVCDSVVWRKGYLSTAETVEILNEFSISVLLREEIVSAVSEKIALDRSYEWAHRLRICVAGPWAACIILSCVLFFGYFDVRTGIKSLWYPLWAVPTIVAAGIGILGLCLYILARCKLVGLVRKANSH
jgi:hypothetical protein